ncbi:hypothetical protein [Plantactinospora sp. WMMB782]|uniref:hypothetical protein n=1 Tax=Plantactinospora sp. WMMB782 TaxID=3404121 RepID=UPI003B9272E8
MIEIEQARELLARAVEVQGKDFVYNPGGAEYCRYRPATQAEVFSADDPRLKTGCVVGEALALGGETRHREYRGSVHGLRDDFPEALSAKAADYLQRAQTTQDGGGTWGEALEAAEAWYQQNVKP